MRNHNKRSAAAQCGINGKGMEMNRLLEAIQGGRRIGEDSGCAIPEDNGELFNMENGVSAGQNIERIKCPASVIRASETIEAVLCYYHTLYKELTDTDFTGLYYGDMLKDDVVARLRCIIAILFEDAEQECLARIGVDLPALRRIRQEFFNDVMAWQEYPFYKEMASADFEKIMEFLCKIKEGNNYKSEIFEELCLPRYNIRPLFRDLKAGQQWGIGLLGCSVLVVAAAFLAGHSLCLPAFRSLPLLFAVPAAILYAGIAIMTIADRNMIAIFTLRVPASLAIGILFFTGFGADIESYVLAKITGIPVWFCIAAIVGAFIISGLYLVYELDGHGVCGTKGNRGMVLRRVLLALAIIAFHSFVLSLLAVGIIEYLIDSLLPTDAWRLVFILMSFLMLVGIFSQIIWDGETVFSPISHKRWRRKQ
jgi:hypothetical protein